MLKYADVRIELTVSFDDNGEDSLNDQAIEAAIDKLSEISDVNDLEGIELVGKIRDIE